MHFGYSKAFIFDTERYIPSNTYMRTIQQNVGETCKHGWIFPGEVPFSIEVEGDKRRWLWRT